MRGPFYLAPTFPARGLVKTPEWKLRLDTHTQLMKDLVTAAARSDHEAVGEIATRANVMFDRILKESRDARSLKYKTKIKKGSIRANKKAIQTR